MNMKSGHAVGFGGMTAFLLCATGGFESRSYPIVR
jgi:hypothetical protein